MRIDRLRLGQAGALEDARPDDAMKPRDVLADDVNVRGPERGQRVIRVLKAVQTAHHAAHTRDTREADTGVEDEAIALERRGC